jgi:hypothetical protein
LDFPELVYLLWHHLNVRGIDAEGEVAAMVAMHAGYEALSSQYVVSIDMGSKHSSPSFKASIPLRFAFSTASARPRTSPNPTRRIEPRWTKIKLVNIGQEAVVICLCGRSEMFDPLVNERVSIRLLREG